MIEVLIVFLAENEKEGMRIISKKDSDDTWSSPRKEKNSKPPTGEN